MLNSEYTRTYSFDIDSYLIEKYSQMNMQTRRSVCNLVLSELDDELIKTAIDKLVAQHAVAELAWVKPTKTKKK